MGILEGKKGVIMGIANDRSIASSIARILHQQGASIAYSYLPDAGDRPRNRQRIEKVTEDLNPSFIAPCDVTKDEDVEKFFSEVSAEVGNIDFLVHSIAFAPTADLKGPTYMSSREGFASAMDVSVYSLLATARHAQSIMNEGGSICAMTYFGGEKVMPGYNLMGLCKSALDTAIQYLASELGSKKIRVNGISAGPIKTLASSAVGDFKKMLDSYESVAPLGSNISGVDVGNSTAFLLSDLSKMITGEIMHVDAGYNIMGAQTVQG